MHHVASEVLFPNKHVDPPLEFHEVVGLAAVVTGCHWSVITGIWAHKMTVLVIYTV